MEWLALAAGIALGIVVGSISERLLAKSGNRSSFPASPEARARADEIRELEWDDQLEALRRLKDRQRKRESADAAAEASRKPQDGLRRGAEASSIPPGDG